MTLTQQDIDTIETIVEDKIGAKTSDLPTKDEFFTKMDEVLGEVQAMRQEFTMVEGHKDRLQDHEERLENIETHLDISSA